MGEHLTKGRPVGVAGRLRISDFEGQDGTRRSTIEVVADQVVFPDAPRKSTKAEQAGRSAVVSTGLPPWFETLTTERFCGRCDEVGRISD